MPLLPLQIVSYLTFLIYLVALLLSPVKDGEDGQAARCAVCSIPCLSAPLFAYEHVGLFNLIRLMVGIVIFNGSLTHPR